MQLHSRNVCTIVSGVSGSGKTTFALRYLVAERDFVCRFLFDPDGEFEERLGLTAAETYDEFLCAAEDGFVVFDPHKLFPGEMQTAFATFCDWCFGWSVINPGRKVILLDEAWKHCDRLSIPHSLATAVQTGRKVGLEKIFTTQLPHKLNGSILNEWTEFACFTLDEEKALDCIADRGADRDEVRNLPLGSFVSLNRHTRGVLRGSLF